MTDVNLWQVLLFSGVVAVPLIICVLFTYTKFDKYQNTDAQRHLIGSFGGAGVAISCGLYIASGVLQYIGKTGMSKTSTIVATGLVLTSAGMIGISSVLEWNN